MWAEKAVETRPGSTLDLKTEDRVRRTLRKVRRSDEELKERGAREPKGAEVSLSRRCQT